MISKPLVVALAAAALTMPAVASAQEATTYTYDALGRLTGVAKSGGPASGTQTTYSHDAASNRTNVTVSGSANGSGSGGGGGASAGTMTFIVVPLNGFTLIPVIN